MLDTPKAIHTKGNSINLFFICVCEREISAIDLFFVNFMYLDYFISYWNVGKYFIVISFKFMLV